MKYKIPNSVISVCAGLPGPASAIGITTDGFWVESQVLPPGAPEAVTDRQEIPNGSGDFTLATHAVSQLNGNFQSHASWLFTNTDAQAVWLGEQSLLNQMNGSEEGGQARAGSILAFTLTEPVDYAISGSFDISALQPGGTRAELFGSLINLDGSPAPIPTTWDELQFAENFTEPMFTPTLTWKGGDGLGGDLGGTNQLTGQLLPGSYEFQMGSRIDNGLGGSGSSTFALALTPSEVLLLRTVVAAAACPMPVRPWLCWAWRSPRSVASTAGSNTKPPPLNFPKKKPVFERTGFLFM